MKLIEPGEVRALLNDGYMLVDTRDTDAFLESFAEEAVSVPFNEDFMEALHEILSDGQQVLLAVEDTQAPAILKAAKNSGMANFYGYITHGPQGMQQAGLKNDMLILIEADEFAMDYQFDEFFLLDIRNEDEFAQNHVEDAENIPLYMLEQALADLENTGSYYLYGNSTRQAVTAASLFKRNGFQRVRPIAGNYEAIAGSGVPVFVKKKASK